ncbi:MAG: ATP synthase F1 subunit delta [Oscillospiraceae bacterium]|nr:ATP synthase F1 subunit delta [Oscillospiraceae bacterium]
MTQLAKVYGGALYELCAGDGIDKEVLEQLDAVSALFAENPAYVRLLDTPTLPKPERTGLVDGAFSGKAHPYLVNFIKILCERGELSAFAGCAAAYRARYHEAHGIVEAKAVSAVPLTDAQQKALQEKLHGVTGKEILLSCRVDPSVLGGVRLSMDGYEFDSTVKHRLEAIRAGLLGTIA